MTDNLGPEIKIDGKRPDWLKDDEKIGIVWLSGERWDNLDTPAHCVFGWENSVAAIMLRADHPYYVATSKGFTYWPGGENVPECDEVLFRDGRIDINDDVYHWKNTGAEDDIIGYRKRAEPVQDDDDYVRVKRMTLAEYQRDDHGSCAWARRVGIIREETAIEKFERDHGGLVNKQRYIVEAFIEWQKNNG